MTTPDTSSFFKVSLKTNNKALALGLQAQKERSRQLEVQVVYLQKQVKALCFELAAKNYKHRKLVGLFAYDYSAAAANTKAAYASQCRRFALCFICRQYSFFFFFFCHSSSSLNLCTATLCSSWTCWPTCSLTA